MSSLAEELAEGTRFSKSRCPNRLAAAIFLTAMLVLQSRAVPLISEVGGNKDRVVGRPVFKTQTLIVMPVMAHAEYEAGRGEIRPPMATLWK